VTGLDIVIQLSECCEESLRKDLTRSAGGSLVQNYEEQVLAVIENLAVRRVSRVRLHNMRQDHDETIVPLVPASVDRQGFAALTLNVPAVTIRLITQTPSYTMP
jgi:hypothetical protein